MFKFTVLQLINNFPPHVFYRHAKNFSVLTIILTENKIFKCNKKLFYPMKNINKRIKQNVNFTERTFLMLCLLIKSLRFSETRFLFFSKLSTILLHIYEILYHQQKRK